MNFITSKCGVGCYYTITNYHRKTLQFIRGQYSSYLKEVTKIERQHLLILDDFDQHPFDAGSRSALMEFIEDRHGKGALIITSQLPVSKRYEVIGEQRIADAILDRIVHTAHRLELKGESLRKRNVASTETES